MNAKAKTSKTKTITVERPGESPFVFPGRLVASADGKTFDCPHGKTRVDWFVVNLYKHDIPDDADRENYKSPFCDYPPPHELDNEVDYVLEIIYRSRFELPVTETRFVTIGDRDMPALTLPYFDIQTEIKIRDSNDEKLVERLKLQFAALADDVLEQY